MVTDSLCDLEVADVGLVL